ncbi:MAG: Ku protein [Myxococcota bacterium]
MAPRAISTGSISFGLVNIPVRLFSAANPSSGISFKLLSKEGHRLKQQYIDPKDDGKVVPRSEMVKGYEVAKDQFVLFQEDELKELQEQATQSIDISEFIPESTVPKLYIQKTWYLGPDRGGDRAYRLLGEALRVTGRCALAKYAARGKMYLVLIAPQDDGLVMYQLHYQHEVQSFDEVPKGDADLKDGELDLAKRIIEQSASEDFRPENYADEVRDRMEAAIQRKMDGQDLTLATDETPKGQIIDLMDALKASLGEAEEESSAAEQPSERKAKSTSKKRASTRRAKGS